MKNIKTPSMDGRNNDNSGVLLNDLLSNYLASEDCDETVRQYLGVSLSKNTLRAYQADLDHFITWGGCIPAKPETIAKYIAQHGKSLAGSTLARRLVAIGRAHAARGLADPAQSKLVRATLQGVRRMCGSQQRQAAPILKQHLCEMVRGLKGTQGKRDRALLLVGFASALRRSELVALNVDDLSFTKEGLIITIRRSKTDQEGVGRLIAIPQVRSRNCPCRALRGWIEEAGIEEGAIFRRVDRHEQVLSSRLSGQTVSLIIKERARAIGLDASKYSGHSLRAGFATAAVKSGASMSSIRAQTGHKSDAMLQRYIRDGQLFNGNPNQFIW